MQRVFVGLSAMVLSGGTFLGACSGASPVVGDAGVRPDSNAGSSSDSGSGSSTPDSAADGEILANTDLTVGWSVTYSTGNGVAGLSSGQYCLRADSSAGYSFVLGYPAPASNVPTFSLVAGSSYSFSYELSGDGVATGPDLCAGGILFQAKIGESASPYAEQSHWCDGVGSSLTTVTHTFTVDGAKPISGLGVAFQGNLSAGGQICLANVQLVKD